MAKLIHPLDNSGWNLKMKVFGKYQPFSWLHDVGGGDINHGDTSIVDLARCGFGERFVQDKTQ